MINRNHLGEKQYSTFSGWKRAIKAIDPLASFEGDSDVCQAIDANGKPALGEWQGDRGILYHANPDDYIPASF